MGGGGGDGSDRPPYGLEKYFFSIFVLFILERMVNFLLL